MNQIEFYNAEFGSVRTVTIDGRPYFVGMDVAKILGYSNTRDALMRNVDDEDRRGDVGVTDAIGRKQNTVLINESGLYSLILMSKLPGAKRFKRWVTSEVLPSLHRRGFYAAGELLNDPDLFIEALQLLKSEREKTQELTETVAELKPKASYYDIVLNNPELTAISTISKDYGWSARKLNEYLHEKGIQYKQGEVWLLYQKYADRGYTNSKIHTYSDDSDELHVKPHTYWTQKGRLFIYETLKADGIVPLIETEDL